MGFNVSTNCSLIVEFLIGNNSIYSNNNGNNGHLDNLTNNTMIYLPEKITEDIKVNCSNLSLIRQLVSMGIDSNRKQEPEVGIAHAGKITFTILAVLIILLTFWGNILVITAVCMERKLRKVGNSFLVNLAISDCLVGCIVMPVALVYHLDGGWRFGRRFCDFWVSMDVICCTASIVNLYVISFDRYNAITQPLQYALKRTSKRAAVFIFFVWMYSTGIALPPLLEFNGRTEAYSTPDSCTVDQSIGYTIYSTTGAFYVPLVVMCILYFRVFKATKNRRKAWIPIPLPASALMKANNTRGHDGGATTEMLVLVSATDSLRRQYRQQQKVQKKKTKSKHKTVEKNETKSSIGNNRTKCAKSQKLSRVNPEIGFRLMRNGGGVFSMISEEDLTQGPSCCISDNCSTAYYQNAVVKLPEIVISNATGCGGSNALSRPRGRSDGAVTTTTATSAPSLCYVKLNSSPMIRRYKRPSLVTLSSKATADTTTSDSLDLFSSTEYDNACCTNSTLLWVNNDEMTKCFDQSSPEEDSNTNHVPVLQQKSVSLTSLVLQDPNRKMANNSVNTFDSKDIGCSDGLQVHDNQQQEAADNNSDKTKNTDREAWNNLTKIRSSVEGLHLSSLVSTTAAVGDAEDLTSDQGRSESAINEHKSIKYSAADDNPIKQMTADGQCHVKPEAADTELSSSGDNMKLEVHSKNNESQQMDHHQVACLYEAPDSVELSRSSDIALDTRRTCLKTMSTTTPMADKYTGSSEATFNKHKINHLNDVNKSSRVHRAKLTKRRHKAQNRNKIIVSQEKRAAKTLGIIMGCFVVCWLPFFIVAVLRPFYPVPSVVTEIITWLGYFNSLINPGIYTFFNQDFRRAFYKIITCRMCRQDSMYI